MTRRRRRPTTTSPAATRRQFIAGAMACGLSATAATALAARVYAQEGTPTPTPIDHNALADDQVNGTFPLVGEQVTLTALIPRNSRVRRFNEDTNAFTRWFEDRTNVHIEWESVPAGNLHPRLNGRLATGDYPGILMSFDPSPAMQLLYGSNGIFLRLNDYIDQHAQELKRVLEQYPQASEVIIAPDGSIYSLPHVHDCIHCGQDHKLFIYQPWLDALGLAMPATIDEFAEMLRAFRDRDPNGNGEADELPLATCADGRNTDLDLALMNAFVFDPGPPWLYLEDGRVTASYLSNGWREGAAWLASLYAEGLIDPESFWQTSEELRAKTGGEGPTRVGVALGGSWGDFVDWVPGDPGQRWAEYRLAPPLRGPAGDPVSPWNPYAPFATGNFVITDHCEDPELAFRWADGLYDLETTMRSVYGEPGTSWRWATQGETGIDGGQALWARIPHEGDNAPSTEGWMETGPSFRPERVRLGEVLADPALRATNLDEITTAVLEPHRQPAEWWLPPLFLDGAQAQLVAESEGPIVTFVREMLERWITGEGSVDEEWDAFQGQLRAKGVQAYLDACQAAFDNRFR